MKVEILQYLSPKKRNQKQREIRKGNRKSWKKKKWGESNF